MALGAMSANPGLQVRIVPVGLSYFHPHKFRSRAVVEFGAPLEVPKELVAQFDKGGDGKRKAVGEMMDIVFDGLKSVTVRAPDYDTLMVSSSDLFGLWLETYRSFSFRSSYKPVVVFTHRLELIQVSVKSSNSTGDSSLGICNSKTSLE